MMIMIVMMMMMFVDDDNDDDSDDDDDDYVDNDDDDDYDHPLYISLTHHPPSLNILLIGEDINANVDWSKDHETRSLFRWADDR